MTRPVYLVDASIYIFQAHFSPYTQVFSETGEDRSAFTGFCRFLLRFLQRARPEYLAVAFDESLFCGFRHALYPDYKSNRVLPDENLARQLQACAELCAALGIPCFGSKVYEADDIIGTLAASARGGQGGAAVSIVTRDKDLAQLLRNEEDHLWDFHADRLRYRVDIEQQYGISPEQFPCFLGLTGDSIDCIPGVPGVGPVAAGAMLREFHSMPVLYERLDEVAGLGFRGARRTAGLLAQHRELAELSRRLATIVECPVDCQEPFARTDISTLRPAPADVDAFSRLLQREQLDADERKRLAAMLKPLLASA